MAIRIPSLHDQVPTLGNRIEKKIAPNEVVKIGNLEFRNLLDGDCEILTQENNTQALVKVQTTDGINIAYNFYPLNTDKKIDIKFVPNLTVEKVIELEEVKEFSVIKKIASGEIVKIGDLEFRNTLEDECEIQVEKRGTGLSVKIMTFDGLLETEEFFPLDTPKKLNIEFLPNIHVDEMIGLVEVKEFDAKVEDGRINIPFNPHRTRGRAHRRCTGETANDVGGRSDRHRETDEINGPRRHHPRRHHRPCHHRRGNRALRTATQIA